MKNRWKGMNKYILYFLFASSLFAIDELPPDLQITHHTLKTEEQTLEYDAITGFCPIFEKGEKIADLFFLSYLKTGGQKRPITFVFPGGPGSAGTQGALSILGPRKLCLDNPHTDSPIIDNPDTLLLTSDLVFVDPINCGYSRSMEKGDKKNFLHAENDIQTLMDFIYTYLNVGKKWDCPIYLLGTSYGTVRCAALLPYLWEKQIDVHGLILNGCALDSSRVVPSRDNPFPEALLVPTLAAANWYHKRLATDQPLNELIEEAKQFTYREFLPYLLSPSLYNDVERQKIEETLAYWTALPLPLIQRHQSKISANLYASQMFYPERKTVDERDLRQIHDFTTFSPDKETDIGPLHLSTITPAFLSYLQNELKTYYPTRIYVPFSSDILQTWTYFHPRYSLLQHIRWFLVHKQHFQVFTASGYFDSRTPFAATEHLFQQLQLPSSYLTRVHHHHYLTGHAILFDPVASFEWRKDIESFFSMDNLPLEPISSAVDENDLFQK